MHLPIQHMVKSEHVRKLDWNQLQKKKHNHTETDDDSVTLDSSSELYNADSNDDTDCTN